jgi:hypothetical protein
MPPVTFDDGVENLEKFCVLLAETTATVEARASTLDAQGAALEKLDQEARGRLDRLGDFLETSLDQLDQRRHAVVEETERLGESAERLTQDLLSDAGERFQRQEDDSERRLDADRSDLETALAGLSEAGFASLATALEEAEAGLTRAGEEAGEGLDGLEQDLGEMEQRANALHSETDHALEAAREALANDEQSLEASAAEAIADWDEAASDVQEDGGSVADGLQALYDVWRDELTSEGEQLMAAGAELMQHGAAFVLEQTGSSLSQAMEAVTGTSLQPLAAETQRLVPVLAEAEQDADSASSLVDELVVVRLVVADVDRLLAALKE